MSTNAADVQRRLNEIVSTYGGWTAMSIDLGHGVVTKSEAGPDYRLRRIIQIAEDVVRRPVQELRVLDLACLEGHYAIEFAMHGADVVGVEARSVNISKAQFAKEVLDLKNLRFAQDDVRNLSEEKYGLFDVVVCSGILYHLDFPDVLDFLTQIAEVCRDVVIIDTYVALRPEIEFKHSGNSYWGRYYNEHAATATKQQKLADVWASVDNVKSVWLTKASLLNALTKLGFSSVLECHNPSMPDVTEDRITLVAIKRKTAEILSSQLTQNAKLLTWPERRKKYHPAQDPLMQMRRRVARFVPVPIKAGGKAMLRALGLMKKQATPALIDIQERRKDGD